MSLSLVSGKLNNLKITRAEADFVFTEFDRNGIARTSILASLVGLSGAAVNLATSDTKEGADVIEAAIAGKQIRGWVWRCPFEEEDFVTVVGESIDGIFFIYAIYRPSDRIIALHPHCLRGTLAHKRNAIKEWRNDVIFKCSGLFFTGCTIDFFSNFDFSQVLADAPFPAIGSFLVFPFIFAYLNWRVASRWMKFARLCDQIFETLGWENPKEVDLPARSKAQRKKGESRELGAFYHRY